MKQKKKVDIIPSQYYDSLMPRFNVTCSTHKPANQAFTCVREVLENDQELKKWDDQISFHFNEQLLTATAKGKFFQAELKIKVESSQSLIDIAVDLPFHLALAKGIIQKTLQKKLSEAL